MSILSVEEEVEFPDFIIFISQIPIISSSSISITDML
jgi:hypothetical protein